MIAVDISAKGNNAGKSFGVVVIFEKLIEWVDDLLSGQHLSIPDRGLGALFTLTDYLELNLVFYTTATTTKALTMELEQHLRTLECSSNYGKTAGSSAQLSSSGRFIMKTFNLSSATSARESFQQQQHQQQQLPPPAPAALIINFKCQAASRAILWYLLLVFNYVAAL